MHEINWSFILKTMQREKCVLVIGPQAITTTEGKSYAEILNEYFKKTKTNLKFLYKDEFFFFESKNVKREAYYEIPDFYKQTDVPPIISQIAELPFNLVISINPDVFLHEQLERMGIEHQFAFFARTESFAKIQPPSKTNPLVYNLFGSVNEEESLIFTHDDLFEFIFSVLGTKGLPVELRTALNNVDNFIFLGFRFDKWYLQLLLKLLIPKEENHRISIEKSLEENTTFYMKQLNIEPVNIEPADFIKQLHQKCSETGILRQSSKNQLSIKDAIKNLIATDEVDDAIKKLMLVFENKNQENIVIIQSSRYRAMNKNIAKGTISDKEATLELNIIKSALLGLVNDIE
jgi:hypothetical protein